MILTAPDPGTVFHIVSHMREIDRDEIYGVRHHEDPARVTMEIMTRPEMTWVAWHAGLPAVVLGGVETCPGVWSIHCFGTDAWPKLALPLTRFVRKSMLPLLFDQFKAHRLEADSIETHVEAHRWMELCSATREGVKRKRGRHGEDYFTYAIVR